MNDSCYHLLIFVTKINNNLHPETVESTKNVTTHNTNIQTHLEYAVINIHTSTLLTFSHVLETYVQICLYDFMMLVCINMLLNMLA